MIEATEPDRAMLNALSDRTGRRVGEVAKAIFEEEFGVGKVNAPANAVLAIIYGLIGVAASAAASMGDVGVDVIELLTTCLETAYAANLHGPGGLGGDAPSPANDMEAALELDKAEPDSEYAQRATAMARKIWGMLNDEIHPMIAKGVVEAAPMVEATIAGMAGGLGAFVGGLVPINGAHDALLNLATAQLTASFKNTLTMQHEGGGSVH